mgnify:CR=1 FL=1
MHNELEFIISEEEKALADKSIDLALEAGASAVQVTLDKARTEIYALLDGEIDNIRQTGDRALTFKIFADGRYGVFSTNKLEENSIRDFLVKAVENVRLLAPDKFRRLPDPADTAKDAVTGEEMGLCWHGYDTVTPEEKIRLIGQERIGFQGVLRRIIRQGMEISIRRSRIQQHIDRHLLD